MRLYFQIIWLIIISSVAQIAFAWSYPPRRQLQRAALHWRPKRLLNHNCEFVDDSGRRFQVDGPSISHSCNNVPPRAKAKRINAKAHGTDIAMKAALDAKQANDDMTTAVKAASNRIKLEFAEKAAAAAKAAEAVLAGKKRVLEQVEIELREAEAVVQDESAELMSAENNSQQALKAHRQAQEELKLLHAALKLARENLDCAKQVSNACQQSMSQKASLLEAAQKRIGALKRQLGEARTDYDNTKNAAYKALRAANEARQRINHPPA